MNNIPESDEKADMFKFDKIIDRKWENSQVLYKVKWSGYDTDQASWIPRSDLKGYEKEIEAYDDKDFKKVYKKSNPRRSQSKKEKKISSKSSKKKTVKNKKESKKMRRAERGERVQMLVLVYESARNCARVMSSRPSRP